MGWVDGWHGGRTDRRTGMVNTAGICAEGCIVKFPFVQAVYIF